MTQQRVGFFLTRFNIEKTMEKTEKNNVSESKFWLIRIHQPTKVGALMPYVITGIVTLYNQNK